MLEFEFFNSDPCRPIYGLFTLNSLMGERLAHGGHAAEVSRPHAAEVSRPHPVEVSIPHATEVSKPHAAEVSRPHATEVTSSCKGKRPRCMTEFTEVRSAQPIQVSSSRLTMYDLQLRMVITSSFELRFRCSWTLWKAH